MSRNAVCSSTSDKRKTMARTRLIRNTVDPSEVRLDNTHHAAYIDTETFYAAGSLHWS